MAATATSSIVDRFHGATRIDRLIAADAATKILTEHDGKEDIYVNSISPLCRRCGEEYLRESERQRFYWQAKK